jgi:hypothetical protein
MAADIRRRGFYLRPGEKDGEEGLDFDNSGRGPLRVPGFGGLPIDIERAPTERFAHASHDWAQPRLTAREMAMLRLMNNLTDLPDWHIKVLGDLATIADLRPGLLAAPLISDAAWEWCVAELRDKAKLFRTTKHIAIFDSASCLVKSDVLVSPKLLEKLQVQVEPLVTEVRAMQDWLDSHPLPEGTVSGSVDAGGYYEDVPDAGSDEDGFSSSDSGLASDSNFPRQPPSGSIKITRPKPPTNAQVLNLVDPSMFPLVYGKTRVLTDGSTVDLERALCSVGRGELASYQPLNLISSVRLLNDMNLLRRTFRGQINSRLYRWSDRFQWLPCEVAFAGQPGTTDTKITSYINNLHPNFHKSMYTTIEKVISNSIKPWNEVVVFRDRYRKPPRIKTFGVSWVPPYPDWGYDLEPLDLEKYAQDRYSRLYGYQANPSTINSSIDLARFHGEYQEAQIKVLEFLSVPDPVFSEPGLPRGDQLNMERKGMKWAVDQKHDSLKTHWLHPEPGAAFPYSEWRAGMAEDTIIPERRGLRWGSSSKPQRDQRDLKPYSISLEDTFRQQGLQVIVKLTSIELTPDKPRYTYSDTDLRANRTVRLPCARCRPEQINHSRSEGHGEWCLDGMLNEHVVATTIVCLSSVNASPYTLFFQVEADLDGNDHHYKPAEFDELAAMYEIWPPSALGGDGGGGPALQMLGRVSIPQGRLLAVPAAVRRRPGPVELLDHTTPGHVRLLELHLVDPYYRVCSTRNVPPQQHEWWAAAGADRIDWARRGVSQEVVNEIGWEIGEWPIGTAEAAGLREERLMEEALRREAAEAGVERYNFDWDRGSRL